GGDGLALHRDLLERRRLRRRGGGQERSERPPLPVWIHLQVADDRWPVLLPEDWLLPRLPPEDAGRGLAGAASLQRQERRLHQRSVASVPGARASSPRRRRPGRT